MPLDAHARSTLRRRSPAACHVTRPVGRRLPSAAVIVAAAIISLGAVGAAALRAPAASPPDGRRAVTSSAAGIRSVDPALYVPLALAGAPAVGPAPSATRTTAPPTVPTLRPTATPTPGASPTATRIPLYDVSGRLGGRRAAVAMSDGRVTVAAGTRVEVFDARDPAHLARLGATESLGGIVQDLVVDAERAYVLVQSIEDIGEYRRGTAAWADLVTLDVSAAAAPRVAGRTRLPAPGYEIALVAGRVYAALAPTFATDAPAYPLAILDVSGPDAPRLVAVVELAQATFTMLAHGEHVFVGGQDPSGDAVVAVLSASRPDEPRLVATLIVGEGVGVDHLALVGHYLHAAVAEMEIVVLDVADPARPALEPLPQPAFQVDGMGATPKDMIAAGDRLVAIEGSRLSVFRAYDRAAWSAPGFSGAWLGSVQVRAVQWWHDRALAADGDRIAVAGGAAGGIAVVDVADPTTPRIASEAPAPGSVTCMHIASALTAVGSHGAVHLSGARDSASPPATGVWSAPVAGRACPVALLGDRLVVSFDNGHRLAVLDVTDPTAPRLVRTCLLDVNVDGPFVLDGTFAYHVGLGDGTRSRLGIVDLRDPDDPAPDADAPWLEGIATDLAVFERHLAVTIEGDLLVFGLADPARPVVRGRLHLGDQNLAMSVVTAGDRAYVVTRPVGRRLVVDAAPAQLGAELMVVDLSDPGAPRLLARTSVDRYAERLSIDGDDLLVMYTNADRFGTYRLRDGAAPASAGETTLPSTITDLVGARGMAFVGTLSDGVVRMVAR